MSVEENLAVRVESHVGGRGLSGFVARAVERELERDSLEEHLREPDNMRRLAGSHTNVTVLEI